MSFADELGLLASKALNGFNSTVSRAGKYYNSPTARRALGLSGRLAKNAISSHSLTKAALLGTIGAAGGYGYSNATGDMNTQRDVLAGAGAGVLAAYGHTMTNGFTGRGLLRGARNAASSGRAAVMSKIEAAAARASAAKGFPAGMQSSYMNPARLALPAIASPESTGIPKWQGAFGPTGAGQFFRPDMSIR